MNPEYISLYNTSSMPVEAFYLEKGNVYFFVTEVDKYTISGQNLIIGGTEIILAKLLGVENPRLETAVVSKESVIKRISSDKVMNYIHNFQFFLNIARVITKHIYLLNKIIKSNSMELKSDELKQKQYCIDFYRIIELLKKEYQFRKLPWLNEIISKHQTNLSYTKGESLFRSSLHLRNPEHSATSGSSMIDVKAGTPFFAEGSTGDELYMLMSGMVDEYNGEEKISSYNQEGSVFGETSFFIGLNRSTSVIARNSVRARVIKKDSLKNIIDEEPVIQTNILCSLARKHAVSIAKIESINTTLIEKNIDHELQQTTPKQLDIKRLKTDLSSLKIDIENQYKTKDAGFLKPIIDSF